MTVLISSWLQRLGIIKRALAPGLLFYGSDKGAFEAIAPLLDQLSKADQRLSVFLCTQNIDLGPWLEQTFPSIKWLPAPFGFGLAAMLFVRRLRLRTVVLLEEEKFPNTTFLTHLKKRSTSIVLMSGRGVAHLKPRDSEGSSAGLLMAVDKETNIEAPADGRLKIIPSSQGFFDQAAAKSAKERLIVLSGENNKWTNRKDRPIRRMVARWLHRRLDDPVFARRCQRFVQRFGSIDQVRRQLGNPDTILCLGNGPSSEDPRLGETSYDAMFRVNHSWKQRPVLTDPEVVFTGGYSTMRAVNPPMFGLQHETGELTLLSAKGLWVFLHRLTYFSVERLGPYLDEFDWGEHRPTNGAAMIAMATAMQPKRLIIAGVDLFRHPDGSYPGDKTTPNAYTPAHSSDKELSFLCHCLDRFNGEVVIFGEILDREWRHHLERRQHLDEVG